MWSPHHVDALCGVADALCSTKTQTGPAGLTYDPDRRPIRLRLEDRQLLGRNLPPPDRAARRRHHPPISSWKDGGQAHSGVSRDFDADTA